MASDDKQESKKGQNWFGRHPILTFIGIIFIVSMLARLSPQNKSSKQENAITPAPVKKSEFNASVNFTGTQFVINNLDQYSCENTRMQINGGSYSYNGYTLEAGQEYTVGAAQFTKNDGTRFNPFSTKPLNFSIGCRGTNELSSAFWYGEFK